MPDETTNPGPTRSDEDEQSGLLRPLSPVRRVVARRMTEAWQTIPAVTLHRAVPFAALLDARERLARPDGDHRKPALDVLLAVLASRALAEHELLNGSWVEERRAVRVAPVRNVAIAVDTPRGLVPVVLRDPDHRPVVELDDDLLEMVRRARDGRSLPGDVAGATFTITNFGGLGVDQFNPIITPPQSAVLGVGAIHDDPAHERPAVLSLTFDHRVVDGADAARYLGRLADMVAEAELAAGAAL